MTVGQKKTVPLYILKRKHPLQKSSPTKNLCMCTEHHVGGRRFVVNATVKGEQSALRQKERVGVQMAKTKTCWCERHRSNWFLLTIAIANSTRIMH